MVLWASLPPQSQGWLEAGMGIQSCKFRKPDILDGRPQLQPHLLPGAPIRVCGSQCECSWAWHQGICWREQEPNSPGLNLSYCVTSGKSLSSFCPTFLSFRMGNSDRAVCMYLHRVVEDQISSYMSFAKNVNWNLVSTRNVYIVTIIIRVITTLGNEIVI